MDFLSSLFSFRGRIGRLEWWGIGLLATLVWSAYFRLFGLSYFKLLLGQYSVAEFSHAFSGNGNALFFAPVLLVVMMWINFAALTKRYHDRDKSGWWFFIAFVPIIGTLWQWIELGFLSGTPGGNSYGPDSKQRSLYADEPATYGRMDSVFERASTPARSVPQEPVYQSPHVPPRRPAQPAGFGKRRL